MDWTSVLIVIGVGHAVLLAAYAGVASQRGSWHAWLAALFALLAIAVTAILVTHRTEGSTERVAVAFEEAAAWFTGPVLLSLVNAMLGRTSSRGAQRAHFIAPVLMTLAQTPPLLLGVWTPVPALLIAYQVGYTVLSATVFLNNRDSSDRTARGYWWPFATLSIMACIHVAQMVRLFAPQTPGADVVPITGALGATAVLTLVLVAQARRIAGPRYARSTLKRTELEAMYAALMRALDGPPALYLRLDLTLGELCTAAQVQPHHASQALSEIGGKSFHEIVATRRVAEAQRRLLDPANIGVAVEAIGMESGFRSRSAFYTAFKAATGATPAEFRRRGAQFMSDPAGKDQDTRAATQSGA